MNKYSYSIYAVGFQRYLKILFNSLFVLNIIKFNVIFINIMNSILITQNIYNKWLNVLFVIITIGKIGCSFGDKILLERQQLKY